MKHGWSLAKRLLRGFAAESAESVEKIEQSLRSRRAPR